MHCCQNVRAKAVAVKEAEKTSVATATMFSLETIASFFGSLSPLTAMLLLVVCI